MKKKYDIIDYVNAFVTLLYLMFRYRFNWKTIDRLLDEKLRETEKITGEAN